jgi:hypothetical protein
MEHIYMHFMYVFTYVTIAAYKSFYGIEKNKFNLF